MSLERIWYSGTSKLWILRPLSWLYGRIASARRSKHSDLASGPDLPILVVGNISVGGTGKTPLTLYLIELARELGLKPGVVSRGYGGVSQQYPLKLDSSSNPKEAGDEPVLLVRRTGVDLVVDPDRVQAARYLAQNSPIDLIISDDGLQHYQLKRDFEIAVVDAERGLGNGQLMPEGPLRESASRLDEVDLVVINGKSEFEYPGAVHFELAATGLVNLASGERIDATPEALGSQRVHALAGIGNPQRFFDTLTRLGFEVEPKAKNDHAPIEPTDLIGSVDQPLIMTEKDAVKCISNKVEHCWALSVSAQLSSSDRAVVIRALKQLCPQAIESDS